MNTQTLRAIAVTVVGLTSLARNADASCQYFECGNNTPVVLRSRVNGLSVKGTPNRDNMHVVPGSVRLGLSQADDALKRSTCNGRHGSALTALPSTRLDLGINQGQLIAVITQDGEPSGYYDGDCMQWATFDLSLPPSRALPVRWSATTVRLAITDMRAVPTWQSASEKRRWVPAYRIVSISDPARRPVCGRVLKPGELPPSEQGHTWIEGWQVTAEFKELTAPGNPPPGFEAMKAVDSNGTEYGVIVQGETYDIKGNLTETEIGPDWFNIACAATAIAKMRLLGIEPLNESPGVTTGTLNMITARYRPQESHTKPGTPLIWKRVETNKETSFIRGQYFQGPIESYWDAKGATCLDHARTMRRGRSPAEETALLQAFRPNLPTCEPSPPANAIWATWSADHVCHGECRELVMPDGSWAKRLTQRWRL